MKTILMKVLHFLWIRRENIYTSYLNIKKNGKIKIDGKVDFKEFMEYSKIFENSGVTKESFYLDDSIMSGDIIGDNLMQNQHRRLTINQQSGPSCVPTAMMRMINYNTGVVISEQKRLEYISEMYELKILSKAGSSVKKVSDYLKGKIQRDFGIELVYFRETIGSEKYNELMAKQYAHGLGGGISAEYVADFKADGKIDIKNYTFKEVIKYYHLFMNLPSVEANLRGGNIVENYNKRFGIRNIYKNNHIDEFGKRGIFFNYGYFFVEKGFVNNDKFEEQKAEIKGNRFHKHLKAAIESGYKLTFDDYGDDTLLTAGEAKSMFDIGYSRKSKDL